MLPDFAKLAMLVGQALQKKHLKLAVAESCTGGWVAQVITSIAGSSAWFERGFVVYSNEAKEELLGVSREMLNKFGTVSQQVVVKMAEGALKNSHADISIAITGIAGPDGGSHAKPVGTIWFAWAIQNKPIQAICRYIDGDRTEIRSQAVAFVLEELICKLNSDVYKS